MNRLGRTKRVFRPFIILFYIHIYLLPMFYILLVPPPPGCSIYYYYRCCCRYYYYIADVVDGGGKAAECAQVKRAWLYYDDLCNSILLLFDIRVWRRIFFRRKSLVLIGLSPAQHTSLYHTCLI